MRREHFTLEVRDVDWVEADGEPREPSVSIDFAGSTTTLRERLTAPDGDLLEDAEVDVAFRLQEPLEEEAAGVVGVTDRLTGDFILELNVEAGDVLRFIRAARSYGEATTDGSGRYRIEIAVDGDPVVTYEKGTFLVYDDEGDLLRAHSLIPSGVEL